MMIASSVQAMEVLDDVREEAAIREAAIRYLAKGPTPAVITRLVQALQDDDTGVRWAAAEALTPLGLAALPEVLKALTDPQRVSDPRLRESAYHILHSDQASVPVSIAELLDALRGQAADIASLVEANRVLRALNEYYAVKAAREKSTSLINSKYGPAQLTGRLGRLGGHHSG